MPDVIDALGDLSVAVELLHGDPWVRVPRESWLDAGVRAKEAGCIYFSFLSGMDWQPSPGLGGEKHFVRSASDATDVPVPGQVIVESPPRPVGGTSRFSVVARLANVASGETVTLTADLAEPPEVASWRSIFPGADWHERETWEMYGIEFSNHGDLRHIYLPVDFEGFPLRKDFPLLARTVRPWPGLVDMEEMPDAKEPGDE